MNSWSNIEKMAELKGCIDKLSSKFEGLIPKRGDIDQMQQLADSLSAKYDKLVVFAMLLYYYAPRSLVGENLPKRMRNLIARTMKCSVRYVSREKNIVLFRYQNDKIFHQNVEDAMRYCQQLYPCA